jgi:hypothetical protein
VILLYGNLSQNPVEFMPPQLVRKHNQIIGFYLAEWISRQGMLKTIRRLIKVNSMLKHGLETKVQAVFFLQEIAEAVEHYEKDMSGGKVILKPKHETRNTKHEARDLRLETRNVIMLNLNSAPGTHE